MGYVFSLVIGILLSFSSFHSDAFASDTINGENINLNDVGQVSLTNSGSLDAQQAFLHGLAQLHNFEYEFAAEDFIRAQRIDPTFALAYWGEAMTYNEPLWFNQNRRRALRALNKYAPSPEARQKKSSGMARDLLAAVDILYGPRDKESNDDLYRDKLAELFTKYPKDVNIASFYALSIMGSAHEGRDIGLYMQAAAIMGDFIHDHPQHPGVAHYLIHATDDPLHAPLGLKAALAYGKIAPNAGHAQHMTTHIFLALGMWEETITANIRAIDTEKKAWGNGARTGTGCRHYSYWLMYGYLQLGQRDEAFDLMNQCFDKTQRNGRNGYSTFSYYSRMRAIYLFDTGEWTGKVAQMEVNFKRMPSLDFDKQYMAGVIKLNQGDVAGATAALALARKKLVKLNHQWDKDGVSPDQPSRARPIIQIMHLEARIMLARNQTSDALVLLREAANLEKALPFGFGPPQPAKPSLELLGETLIRAGKPDEAHKVLTKALTRTKGKALTVAALERAKEVLTLVEK